MADTDAQSLQNYMKLQYLLNTTATKCLREMFVTEWKANTNMSWENGPADGNFFIHNQGYKIYQQGQKLQKELMSSGNLARWDIPLLSQAIRLFPSTIAQLSTTDRNNGLNILKEERNKLAHHGSTDIADDHFKIVWNDATRVLLKFGVPFQTLNDARNILPGNVEMKKSDNTENSNPNLTKAVELKDDGNQMFKAKKFTEAIAKYSGAIRLSGLPFQVLAALYSNRSLVYYQIEDFESAKSDAKGAVLVHPIWSKGYFRLAAAYEALSKLPQALKNYKLALSLDPEDDTLKNSVERLKFIIARRSRDEHLDPLSLETTREATAARLSQMGITISAHRLQDSQRLNAAMGLSIGICAEGHNYVHGIGRKQDYEQAAKCFGRAASKGNAEGLYNLALLTIEGKGVSPNYMEAVRLLREAASQEPMLSFGGMKMRNLGKAEAEHSLGLWHENGTGVTQDLDAAVKWYLEGIKHGMGASCNNLALMYSRGAGVQYDLGMAVDLWKLGAYYHTPRAVENLALEYIARGNSKNGWTWFDFAAALGCTSIVVRREEFVSVLGPNTNPPFDEKQFKEGLKIEVLKGRVKHLVCPEDELMEHQMAGIKQKLPAGGPVLGHFKTVIVRSHRQGFETTAQVKKTGQQYTTTPGSVTSKGITDLFGLKPIFFEEMVATEDHIYDGFVIKLTIIEDAITGRPSIPLIVEDEKKQAHRVYIYNYLQKQETIQETLGYGCKISIVNPYFRIAADGLAAIRVDDPTTIFFHSTLREMSRCRFCGKGESNVTCRKCRRCSYCSKQCLRDDAKMLAHEYICKKRI